MESLHHKARKPQEDDTGYAAYYQLPFLSDTLVQERAQETQEESSRRRVRAYGYMLITLT